MSAEIVEIDAQAGGGPRPIDDFPDLINRARALDEAALDELYRRHVTAIYRYAYARLGSREDAEEATSETFLAMLKTIERYQGDHPAAFGAWLIQIARSRVADHYRRAARRPTVALDSVPEGVAVGGQVDPEEELDRSLDRERLLEAVSHLTPEQRELIILKFLIGFDNETLARITQRNPGAINSLQHRALRSLNRILSKEAD